MIIVTVCVKSIKNLISAKKSTNEPNATALGTLVGFKDHFYFDILPYLISGFPRAKSERK